MKKTLISLLLIAAIATSLFAGALYTDIQTPFAITGNTIGRAAKSGSGEFTSILGLVTTGDASINTIAHEAGITKIYFVDTHVVSILGIWAKVEITVYGE